MKPRRFVSASSCRAPLALCAGLLAALAVPAADAAQWMIAPRGSAVAGEALAVDVMLANDTVQPLAEGLPAKLPARVRLGTGSIDVTLELPAGAAQPPGPVRPGEFRRATYSVRLPRDFTGPVTLELAGSGAQATIVAAAPPAAPAAASRTAPAAAALAAPANAPSESPAAADADADKPPADRNVAAALAAISSHEPMYFIFGTRDSATIKFQLSMKYRLLDQDTWLGARVRALSKIHVGYTQTSIWDIGQSSAPFRDTSYRPSIFYFEPDVWRSADNRYALSFSGGLEHESNGKDGAQSRSLNTFFLRPRLRYALGNDYFLRFDPKVYAYLERSDNADIPRYRGYGDYAIGIGRSDEWLVNTTVRAGTGGYGSVQVDGSWRIRARVFANTSGFVYAQYFNGYGESLIDYNVKRRAQFRVGFAIVR
jgi:phospholipase A1/A2